MNGPVLLAMLIGTPRSIAAFFAMSRIRPSIDTQNFVLSFIVSLLYRAEVDSVDKFFVVRVRGPVTDELEYVVYSHFVYSCRG